MSIMSSTGVISSLAEYVGTSDAALRLLLTIITGYPVAFFYRKYICTQIPSAQHAFFIISGIVLGFFNYGTDILHCIFAVLFTYLTITLIGANKISVIITFVFNITYLLAGYWVTSSEDYDILWTMPFCVLTLRLIGLSYDVYDSFDPKVDRSKLGSENKKCLLDAKPTFIEVLAFSFFPSSFLVGPQYPIKRYLNFVYETFEPDQKKTQLTRKLDCVGYGLRRLCIGIIYLSIYQIGSMYYKDSYLLSEEFTQISFIRRIFVLGIWGRLTLYKYISCWLLTEGSCIIYGLTYDGRDDKDKILWTGCENVKPAIFENCTLYSHYILSFNCNTNHWVAQYIYKRLKFLGNKFISQGAALLFLAVWHGLHSGYYVSFFLEFIIMYFEKDFENMLKRYPQITNFFNRSYMKPITYVCLRLYTILFMGFCMISFVLLSYEKYLPVFAAVYYIDFVVFLPWAFLYKSIVAIVLKSLFKQQAKDVKDSTKNTNGKIINSNKNDIKIN